MIIDSSALVAIVLEEPEKAQFLSAVEKASINLVAAPNLVETNLVLLGRGGELLSTILENFMAEAGIQTLSFTADHALAAREAFLRFGKGRHKAGLNFGDCMAYATAKVERMPLLFKGADFALTDVEVVSA